MSLAPWARIRTTTSSVSSTANCRRDHQEAASSRGLFVGGLVASLAALLVASLAALGWFLIRYGHGRAYRLELAVISIVWLTLIPGAFMMAAVFRRHLRERTPMPRSSGP